MAVTSEGRGNKLCFVANAVLSLRKMRAFAQNIESVRFRSNAWEKQIQRFFSSEIFTINDIAGNEFVFYSFNNCKDFKAIVEQQMRNVVGVSERED